MERKPVDLALAPPKELRKRLGVTGSHAADQGDVLNSSESMCACRPRACFDAVTVAFS